MFLLNSTEHVTEIDMLTGMLYPPHSVRHSGILRSSLVAELSEKENKTILF